MKRLFIAISLSSLIAFTSIGAIVFAAVTTDALYTGIVRVTNNSTATTGVSVPFTASSANYIAGGFMNSSANNTAITQSAGADAAYMPGFGDSNPWVIFVNSIGLNTLQNNTLFMGGLTDMAAKIRYFPTAEGMTTADSASLEFSDNFTYEVAGWINTDNDADKNIAFKEQAFKTFISPIVSGNITALIWDSGSTTLNLVPNGAGDYTGIDSVSGAATHWEAVDDPPGAPDDATTQVLTRSLVQQKDAYTTANWTASVEAAIESVKVYFRVRTSNAADHTFAQPFLRLNAVETAGTEIDRTGDTNWTDYNEILARPGGGSWSTSDINALQVAIGLKQSDNTEDAQCTQVYIQVSYKDVALSVSATGVSNGEHKIKIAAELITETFYPSLDGIVSDEPGAFGATNWATLIANPGTNSNDSSTSNLVPYWRCDVTGQDGNFRNLYRGIILFDTSGLNDNVVILNATFSIRGLGKTSLTNSPTLNIYTSNPASKTALASGDYDSFGSANLSDSLITFAGFDTTDYNDFALNATGIATVNMTGPTQLGLRESFYDVGPNTPTWTASEETYFQVYFSEAGTGFEPKLVVSYMSFRIYIDDVEIDSTGLGGNSVPDNANNWSFLSGSDNETMPLFYMEYQEIEVGGVLQQSIEWEYDTVFTDLSGNSHDATPTFRTTSTDPDVSAALLNFGPISEARAPAYSINISTAGWITEAPSQTGNFTTTTIATYPGREVIVAVTTASNVPIQLTELILAGVGILALSFFVSWMMRRNREGSLFVKILIIAAGLGILTAVSIIDDWMLWLFLMISIALTMMASQRVFTGTGNAGNNLIGFSAMAFVGMTTINRILEGRFIQSSDVSVLRDTLAFQPFNVFGLFTIPVPNTNFLLNGIPALLRWDYSFFGGNAQILQYLLYSITAAVSFMLFVLVFGAIYQMFSRGRG